MTSTVTSRWFSSIKYVEEVGCRMTGDEQPEMETQSSDPSGVITTFIAVSAPSAVWIAVSASASGNT